MALDYPLCHMELRFVATSSPDAFGADADRLEMRFLSAGDRLDVSAKFVQAPPSMLVVSRVTGGRAGWSTVEAIWPSALSVD